MAWCKTNGCNGKVKESNFHDLNHFECEGCGARWDEEHYTARGTGALPQQTERFPCVHSKKESVER